MRGGNACHDCEKVFLGMLKSHNGDGDQSGRLSFVNQSTGWGKRSHSTRPAAQAQPQVPCTGIVINWPVPKQEPPSLEQAEPTWEQESPHSHCHPRPHVARMSGAPPPSGA